MMTAHDTVTSMIDHMTNTGNKAHFRLTKGIIADIALRTIFTKPIYGTI